MCIPLDDHMVHRGHGVFDAGSICGGRPVNLEAHVLRLLRSADGLSINNGRHWTPSSISSIIEETIAISECTDGMYRAFLSVGRGSFGIHSGECSEPCLYVVVYTDRSALSNSSCPHAEITISENVVPMKHPRFAGIKSVNYINNVLLADYALSNGGKFGIWIGSDGTVKESSILCLVLITRSHIFVTPAGEDILDSTTVRKVAEYCMSKQLVAAVERMRVDIGMLLSAAEVMLCGADTHIHPIIMIDGKPIADGKVGPVTEELVRFAVTSKTNYLA